MEGLKLSDVSSFDYSSGNFLFPPEERHKLGQAMVVHSDLSCGFHIKIPYYGNGELGRWDLCSHCGGTEAEIDSKLKKNQDSPAQM